MILSDKIKRIPTQSDFVFWVAVAGQDLMSQLSRASAFNVEENGSSITFYVPKRLFGQLSPAITEGCHISFLMASIKNFESYQVKGSFLKVRECTEDEIDFYRLKTFKIIDLLSDMGLDGNGVFGFLLDQSSVALTMSCTESYEQTPKPGTGTALTD